MQAANYGVILTPGTAVEASYDLDTQFPGHPVDEFGAGIGLGAQACQLALRLNTNCLIPPALLSPSKTLTNTFGSPLISSGLGVFPNQPSLGYILFSDPSASIDISTVSFVPLSFNGVEYLNPDGSAVAISTALSVATVPEPATWTLMGLGFAALGFAGCCASGKRAALHIGFFLHKEGRLSGRPASQF